MTESRCLRGYESYKRTWPRTDTIRMEPKKPKSSAALSTRGSAHRARPMPLCELLAELEVQNCVLLEHQHYDTLAAIFQWMRTLEKLELEARLQAIEKAE